MTMTSRKNSTFELRICGQSMILRRIVFFQDGVQWTSNMSNMYERNILFLP
jgi:hypothetical protein